MSPAEYQAKRDWLRSNPYGAQAQMVKRELRAWDRELESQGEIVEAWLESARTRLSLSPWYVAIFHSRPGQPLASTVRHKDRYCQHIANIGNEDVREATESDVNRTEFAPRGAICTPASRCATSKTNAICRGFESGRQDLNLRPPGPQPERSGSLRCDSVL